MSIPTGVKPLRPGRASAVTDLGDRTILRTGGRPEEEARMMAVARAHGIRVPTVHEVLPDGLIMELVPGGTLADALRRRPWTVGSAARTVANLHRQLHEVPYGGGRLVHYDLHPENILLGPDGPVLIDWTNARGGDPDADVALTWIILVSSSGLGGQVFAPFFTRHVGRDAIRRGFVAAAEFRMGDPHVTDQERRRVRRLRP